MHPAVSPAATFTHQGMVTSKHFPEKKKKYLPEIIILILTVIFRSNFPTAKNVIF